jgi:hypothetical protein
MLRTVVVLSLIQVVVGNKQSGDKARARIHKGNFHYTNASKEKWKYCLIIEGSLFVDDRSEVEKLDLPLLQRVTGEIIVRGCRLATNKETLIYAVGKTISG